MKLSEIQFIFNRSLSYSFEKKKLFITAIILALCGIMIVFLRGLALAAVGNWLSMSLLFLSFFLTAGVLFGTGIFLIRIYHDEVKNKANGYRNTLNKSWELLLGASYLSVPIILTYLMLWMLLGIFTLFTEIPFIGDFFAVILILGPFLINLGSLLLCLLNVVLLFYVSPIIALKGLSRMQVVQQIVRRFKKDLFSNVLLAVIGIIPLLSVAMLLLSAGALTDLVFVTYEKPIYNVMQWFFIMIPFAIFLAPAIVFFFNFAAESHVLMARDSSPSPAR